MCEREAAIFPHSPFLRKVPNHVHTTTPKHRCSFTEMNSVPKCTSMRRRQDSTPAFSPYFSQSARCLSGQSLASLGIQKRVQLFTLTQPPCTQYSCDLCGLASWTRYNPSVTATLQHASIQARQKKLLWQPNMAEQDGISVHFKHVSQTASYRLQCGDHH